MSVRPQRSAALLLLALCYTHARTHTHTEAPSLKPTFRCTSRHTEDTQEHTAMHMLWTHKLGVHESGPPCCTTPGNTIHTSVTLRYGHFVHTGRHRVSLVHAHTHTHAEAHPQSHTILRKPESSGQGLPHSLPSGAPKIQRYGGEQRPGSSLKPPSSYPMSFSS